MCRAAKTPSTMAQQKAATTPKLMKTIDATNCGLKSEEHQLRHHLLRHLHMHYSDFYLPCFSLKRGLAGYKQDGQPDPVVLVAGIAPNSL